MAKNEAATIPRLFAEVVAARRDHPALVTAEATLTYGELEERSAKMARALLKQGMGKGTRIALMAPDSLLWIVTFLASLRVGALLTTVSTLCAPRELAHILRNSDIQILIGARRFLRHDFAEKLEKAFPELGDATPGELQIPAAPYLRSIWLEDAAGINWARPVNELMAAADGPGAPSADLLNLVEEQIIPGDEAVIIYTSGSTSLPKAVVHTHWNISRHPPELAKLFFIKPEDRMMPLLPAFWVGGMNMLLEVFSVGATLVYPPSPDIDDVLEAIDKFSVNRINSWGDMLVKLREAAMERDIDVDAIIGLGQFHDRDGEPIPSRLQTNMLGMSESFGPHSAEPLKVRLSRDKAGASGRSVNNYERRIVDPKTGEELPLGEVGEVQLRGGALMAGFYKVPRRDVFTEDGFYPTGDLAWIDGDGYLYFVARRNDMIKTKATNVSRLEVEAAMRELPEIQLPVVTGLEDPEQGQRVVAVVVPRPGTSPTEESIRAALRESLSSYKIPRNILFVSEGDIPRTSAGKIKLPELAEMIRRRL